ncbi:DUF3631 domain-containing protein, partial [Pseudomonas helleri]
MTTPDRFADQWATTDKVGDAVKKLGSDAGALYEPGILSLLQKMRKNEPSTFARLRAKVKDTKQVSMAEFDRLTAVSEDEEDAAHNDIFGEIEPWPKPVSGEELLDDIA